MNDTDSQSFPKLLTRLLERQSLTGSQMSAVFAQLLAGELGEAEAAALLIALRMKGETAEELAAAAHCLRAAMLRFETGRHDLLDTCGTGGDDSSSFNISTAAALVVAAAGVPVVKHGNRAVSSRSGSADVLAELGLDLDASPDEARRLLDSHHFAFCFAPHFHPVLKNIGALRRRLGVRTVLNLLGPLANPANARYQLLGVGRLELLEPMAGALARLGIRQAYVVCSGDGLDEVSLSAPTHFRRVFDGCVTSGVWQPDDFGLEPCVRADLFAADAKASAKIIEGVLNGQHGPARRITVANAAAALMAAEQAPDVRAGVALAEQAISSGRTQAVLAGLRDTRYQKG